MARRHRNRATAGGQGESRTSFGEHRLGRVTAHGQRVDGAEVVKERDLRAPVGQHRTPAPLAVTSSPIAPGPAGRYIVTL